MHGTDRTAIVLSTFLEKLKRIDLFKFYPMGFGSSCFRYAKYKTAQPTDLLENINEENIQFVRSACTSIIWSYHLRFEEN